MRWAAAGVVLLVAAGVVVATRPSPSDVQVVPRSIAADCSKAVDREIGAWLAGLPPASTAAFRRGGCYAQDGSVVLRDRRDLVVDARGATFKAITPGDDNRANWRISGGRDVHLRNMTIRGIGMPAPRGQSGGGNSHQHGVAFDAVTGASLTNVRIIDVGGDGIEAEPDFTRHPGTDYGELPPARSIHVSRVRIEHAGRHGVGLTAVDGFTLRDSYIHDVYNDSIDIEIDEYRVKTRNITIERNRFGAVYFAVLQNDPGVAPDNQNVVFRDNVMTQVPDTCFAPVNVGTAGFRKTGYSVTGNTLLTKGDGMSFIDVEGRIVDNTLTYKGTGGCNNTNWTPPYSQPVRQTGSALVVSGNRTVGFPSGS
jgi:hypothetical protein